MGNSYGVVLKRALDSYYVPLNRQKTNGHDFCELIVDLEKSRFTAILYGGECYTYCYASNPSTLEDLIILLSRDAGYLYRKLAKHSYSNFVDVDATSQKIKELLLELEYMNEDVEELLKNFEGYSDLSIESFYDVWFSTFKESALNEMLPEDVGDILVAKKDDDCEVFCNLVAPILADFLKTQM